MSIDNIINELTAVLKRTANGSCSIALAGAHTKGTADADSDLDFYMIVEDVKPYGEILEIIQSVADNVFSIYISSDFDETPYGGSIDFRYQGIPIETTVHTASRLSQRVNECLDGKFEIIPQTWTSNGYYTFIYLSELHFIQPLYDPNEVIKTYKSKLKQYPEKLRESIVDCFFERANTWLNNFHYESAIQRSDVLFTAPIVLHTILDMIQVIFALNRKYFYGDKKLQSALARMPYCPVELLDNLEFLLSASSDSNILEKQCAILRDIRDELFARIKVMQ
ncbi:MAG: DUF4037 domain-containing protein [Oscillospiraceae bacterium]|nr:DUF4037 domain-containing protein [Oscillospiraceae bacterium]